MKNMLYKEFHLVIHPLFYLVPLCGALLLIPQWVYFVAPMYFFFIALPNIFATGKAQNDIGFSAVMPIRRGDIVKARWLSVIILELLQILVTAVFAVINLAVYTEGNFLLDSNATYIGCVFIMFAVFNIVFFPMFYRTAYKIGVPVIAATAAAVLFAAAVEILIITIPAFKVLDGKEYPLSQLLVLVTGIIFFVLLNIAALKMSVKRFENIDL